MARQRLLAMCPAPFRVTMQPMVDMAIAHASDAELGALLIDIDQVKSLAETGDVSAIGQIAKKYGATDDMVATYLPALGKVSPSALTR